MQDKDARIHYYHADASAFGGWLRRPLAQRIPIQAALSLPPSGGYGSTRMDAFNLEGLLSFESAYTQVSGDVNPKDGAYSTMLTSTVEGLNLVDVVTADRVVTQIATSHPSVGYNPKITFLGTRFENVKIGGYSIDVTLDLDFCDQGTGEKYPDQPCVSDPSFLKRVEDQYRRLAGAQNGPDWVKSRYQWDNAKRTDKGFVLCSLVQDIKGEFPGTRSGHALDIPEFGRLLLGELLVDHGSYQLTMMRFQLGCATDGDGTVAVGKINGRTAP
jgi:hypothetical protein